jgi:3-oxoacyl-[acyl-carrier protein] reductase
MKLAGAVAVITGSGTGIGRATALSFAEQGATVIACGRRYSPLIETAQLIQQGGTDVLAIPTDVRDYVQVNKMMQAALERFGRVDVLVNNAGAAIQRPIHETTEEEWDRILDTNLKGTFLCCKVALPSMIEAGSGVIINVSSILGLTGIANFGAYCASKFGVIGFTQALGEELKPKGIRVFAVCPGPTQTDLHCRLVGPEKAKQSMSPERVAAEIRGLVTGEIVPPSGVATVVDELPVQRASHKSKSRWRERARQWLKPELSILRRSRGQME